MFVVEHLYPYLPCTLYYQLHSVVVILLKPNKRFGYVEPMEVCSYLFYLQKT